MMSDASTVFGLIGPPIAPMNRSVPGPFPLFVRFATTLSSVANGLLRSIVLLGANTHGFVTCWTPAAEAWLIERIIFEPEFAVVNAALY